VKKTFATSAIATIAAANLIFSAPFANAATTYTVDRAAESGGMYMTGGNVSEFDGKAIVKRRDESFIYHLMATDRSTNTTVDLVSALLSDGRYFLSDNSVDTSVVYDGKFWDWVGDDLEGGYDLLYSDGTVAGTGVVEIDCEDPYMDSPIGVSDGIYFIATDSVTDNEELFFFDGSTVTDMNVTDGGSGSNPEGLREFQGKVSFVAVNQTDQNIKQYTAVAGVKTLVGEVAGMWSSDFELDGPDVNANHAYAFTYDYNTETSSLWWTDDVDAPYELVTDEAGDSGAFFNGKYYFDGVFVSGSYTGLASAVGSVVNVDPDFIYPGSFYVLDDVMYFGAYDDTNETHWNLYVMGTDGVVHLVLQDWDSGTGAGVGDSFFFQHDGGVSDSELWVADADGARLVSNIREDGESDPSMFGVVGDEVCFGAFPPPVEVEAYDLYCVSGSALADTGVDGGAIGAVGVVTLLVGGGLAVVRRRARITE
jgi:hypothetical protein